jgi:hypothetical protein
VLVSITTVILLELLPTPMAGDDEPQELIKVTKDFGNRYVEISAVRVPESDRSPEGIKYSMQYGNAAGETIIRYDNFPDIRMHPDITNTGLMVPWRMSISTGYNPSSSGSKLR